MAGKQLALARRGARGTAGTSGEIFSTIFGERRKAKKGFNGAIARNEASRRNAIRAGSVERSARSFAIRAKRALSLRGDGIGHAYRRPVRPRAGRSAKKFPHVRAGAGVIR